jgi:deoxyribonuclease V
MANRVAEAPLAAPVRFIAGLDAAFSTDGRRCIAAVVLWDKLEQRVAEQHVVERPLRFPYVPGLLSFREAPALLAALRQLAQVPELLMCDGQGLAHPRRFGIACHLGVLCRLPAVGCAKSRLTGTHAEPASRRGASTPLSDGEQLIGSVLRTQTGVRPVYVSVGHLVTLEAAVSIVLECATSQRLPEPTRLADRLVARAKRGQNIS